MTTTSPGLSSGTENLLGVDLEGIADDRAIEHERGDEARRAVARRRRSSFSSAHEARRPAGAGPGALVRSGGPCWSRPRSHRSTRGAQGRGLRARSSRTTPAVVSGRPACLARPRVRSFFARDPSPREETPERAVADREAAARECSPQLLERDIRRLLDKREDQAGPRASMRPERRSPPRAFGRASPCMHSRARQRIALDALTPNRWAACRHERPPAIAASTRVLRSSESAFDMSAGLRPADSLNYRCADLGIDIKVTQLGSRSS